MDGTICLVSSTLELSAQLVALKARLVLVPLALPIQEVATLSLSLTDVPVQPPLPVIQLAPAKLDS